MNFSEAYAFGQIGESKVARWCRAKGNAVLPVYEKEIDTGKGPRFFAPSGEEYAAPDMFVMPKMRWIEAKRKSAFSWHRISGRWCTGIDLHHYRDYERVQDISGCEVWVCFLHMSDVPDDRDLRAGSPPKCPVGLFTRKLADLMTHENHRHENGSKRGMVYWAHETLLLAATLDELAAF